MSQTEQPLPTRLPAGTPGRPRLWPAPQPSNLGLLIGTGALSVLAAATLWDYQGLQWPLLAFGIAALVRFTVRSPAPLNRSSRRWRRVSISLALGLIATIALRDSAWLMVLVVLMALVLIAAALIPSGRTLALLSAPALGAAAGLRGLVWLVLVPPRKGRIRAAGPAVRGSALAFLLVVVVGGLLGSADEAFAGLAGALVPDVPIHSLPARMVVAALVFTLIAAIAFGVAAPPALFAAPRRRDRPAVEWAIPVVVLLGLLGAFLVVQAAVLFGAYPPDLVTGDLTPAERARAGFGQLVCVTLVVAATLGWAGARTATADRRLLMLLGGPLVLEVLVLVASALRRMYLYQQTFGLTVLRLDVAVFEIWLALALVTAAVLWLLGRSSSVPRFGLASAGAVLLALTLVGPDAIVAQASVHRYAQTGRMDAYYLRTLSSDAVPILAQLPEPARTCALGSYWRAARPWYTVNLSRIQAAAALQARPVDVDACPNPSMVAGGGD